MSFSTISSYFNNISGAQQQQSAVSTSSVIDNIESNSNTTMDNRDAITCILLRSVDPRTEHIDWCHIAATIYSTCSVLLTPDEVSEFYFALLAKHDGRAKVESSLKATGKTGASMEECVVKVKDELQIDGGGGGGTLLGSGGGGSMIGGSGGGKGGGGGGAASGSKHNSQQQQWLSSTSNNTSSSFGGTTFGQTPQMHIRHTCDPKETVQLRRELLMDLLGRCRGLPSSEIFFEPVAPRTMMLYSNQTLGPYSDVVRSPMSLLVLQQRILNGEVQTLVEMKSQIWLIAANCVMFNAPEGGYPGVAREFAEAAMAILDDAVLADENPQKRMRI